MTFRLYTCHAMQRFTIFSVNIISALQLFCFPPYPSFYSHCLIHHDFFCLFSKYTFLGFCSTRQRVIMSQIVREAIIFADCPVVQEATNNPCGLIYWARPAVYFCSSAPCLTFQLLCNRVWIYPSISASMTQQCLRILSLVTLFKCASFRLILGIPEKSFQNVAQLRLHYLHRTPKSNVMTDFHCLRKSSIVFYIVKG